MDKVIKPAIGKFLVMRLLKTLSIVLLVIILVAILHFTVGLDIFLTPLEAFNINFDLSGFLMFVLIVVVAAFVFAIILGYLSVMSLKYEFSGDHLTVFKPVFLIITKKIISYKNLSRVYYDNSNFFSGLLNTGNVTLDLSSMGEKELVIKYVDKPADVANFISEVLRSYQLKVQAEYTEKYRMKDILDKSGI